MADSEFLAACWSGFDPEIVLFGGLRASLRLFREHFLPMVNAREARRAIVVGAKWRGETLVATDASGSPLGYRPVAFLDDKHHVRVSVACRYWEAPADVGRLPTVSSKRCDGCGGAMSGKELSSI